MNPITLLQSNYWAKPIIHPCSYFLTRRGVRALLPPPCHFEIGLVLCTFSTMQLIDKMNHFFIYFLGLSEPGILKKCFAFSEITCNIFHGNNFEYCLHL